MKIKIVIERRSIHFNKFFLEYVPKFGLELVADNYEIDVGWGYERNIRKGMKLADSLITMIDKAKHEN
jgi:hypothetical protein